MLSNLVDKLSTFFSRGFLANCIPLLFFLFLLFWSRLQKAVAADSTLYSNLQDAKSQLDFLVSMFWHTTLYTLIWVVVLPWTHPPLWEYLVIAMLGPLGMAAWYAAATTSYRAFSDLMRSATDLYRLELLKQLNLNAPASAEEERNLWLALEQRLGYGDRTNLPLKVSP